jgi:hypothetical protein
MICRFSVSTRKALRIVARQGAKPKPDPKSEDVYKLVQVRDLSVGDKIVIQTIVNGKARARSGIMTVVAPPWASACENEIRCNCKVHILDSVLVRVEGNKNESTLRSSKTRLILKRMNS